MGTISLTASETAGAGNGSGFNFPVLPKVDITQTGITLNTAVVEGGAVTFTAIASSLHVTSAPPGAGALGTLIQTGIAYLQNFSIIGALAVSTSQAAINLGAASAITAVSFTAMSTATSDAETNPISIDLGVSIAIVNTSATITAAGHITTTGDTTLDAGAMNTMAAIARAGGSLQGAGAAVTIGVENSTANSTVTGTGQVRAGGDLTVQANTVTNKALQTITTTGDDGNVGVGVAVAYMNNTTTAALNGPVSSGKDTLVQANEVKNGFSGTKFFFLPTLFTGVAVNTGVGNDDTGDLLLNMQGAATTYVLGQAQKLFGSTASSNSPSSGPAKDSTPSFQAAAAVAIDVEDNAATATIGANNAVKVGGNLIVDANMNNRPNVIASSGIAQPEGSGGGNSSEFNGSAAVAIGSYTNTATSNIGAGAAVDAAKKLSVTAEALNDFQFTYGVNVVQAIAKKPTYTTTDSGINSVTVNPGDIVEVESNDSGNGTVGHWYQYVGAGSLTSVNLSTQSFFNTSLWNDLGPGWEYRWGSGLKQLTTYLDNSFGADNNLFDTWTQATSNDNDKNSNSTAEIVVAGSVTYDALNQTANASIGTGAQINQDTDPAYRTGSQSVFVLATGTNSSVNAGGSVQVPGFSGSNSELQVGVNAPGAGVEAKQACVGAALVVVDYSDNVTATVNSGVNLYADSLDVDAETAVFNFTIMISGGSSDSFGFIGVLSLVNVNNTTLAQVAAGSTLDVGNGNVVETFAKPTSPPAFTTAAIQANALPGTAGTDASGDPTNTVAASTIVQAHDWLDLWDFVGGIMAGGNAGVALRWASAPSTAIRRLLSAIARVPRATVARRRSLPAAPSSSTPRTTASSSPGPWPPPKLPPIPTPRATSAWASRATFPTTKIPTQPWPTCATPSSRRTA